MIKLKERFNKFVKKSSTGCHLWIGGMRGNNYGSFRWKDRKYGAHRFSLFLYKDFDLNSKLCVRHSCDNKLCVNPDHLSTGTHADNMKDMSERKRQQKARKNILFWKDIVIDCLKKSYPIKEIALFTGISNETLYRWRKDLYEQD